ncbi:MAG: ATP-binding protein [Spirochaetales bacterium]|nr:ATP-binding protein [Spirochaetales bacterium]
MPTAEQIKALVKAHFDPINDKFTTITLQIAAHEATLGHINLAEELKYIIDNEKQKKPKILNINNYLQGLLIEVESTNKLSDLVLPERIIERIKRIEREFIQKEKLRHHDLKNRRKILFSGPPGTGKTMTASVISYELKLPLNIILIDKLVTKFMGETSAKLRQVFDYIRENQAVYLFDEFDAIGTERAKDNDIGEMRRVLNSFLQFIERDQSESIILAATNNLALLDQALFRRFDDVIHFHLPNDEEKARLIANKLGNYKGAYNINDIVSKIGELSHAEIAQACNDAVKEAILSDKQKVEESNLIKMIDERKSAYEKTK